MPITQEVPRLQTDLMSRIIVVHGIQGDSFAPNPMEGRYEPEAVLYDSETGVVEGLFLRRGERTLLTLVRDPAEGVYRDASGNAYTITPTLW